MGRRVEVRRRGSEDYIISTPLPEDVTDAERQVQILRGVANQMCLMAECEADIEVFSRAEAGGNWLPYPQPSIAE